jgi:hypothetical protein
MEQEEIERKAKILCCFWNGLTRSKVKIGLIQNAVRRRRMVTAEQRRTVMAARKVMICLIQSLGRRENMVRAIWMTATLMRAQSTESRRMPNGRA